MLTCPVCRLDLGLEDRTYRCERGHAFDRAREGYVDLLPVGHGRSGITGDTRDMARARQRFQEAGHFRPLTDRLVERVAERLSAGRTEDPGTAGNPSAAPGRPGSTGIAAEAGCGVGHYIGAVARHCAPAAAYGFDVSREALRVAGRAHPQVTFARNDVTHRLCLPDGAVDVLLDVFAPRNPAEFRRVLRPDGLLVVAIPAPDHLAGLRERLPLLDIPSDKRERTLDQLSTGFRLVWEESLHWRARLTAPDVEALVRMTPSAFHLGEAELSAVGAAAEVGMRVVVLGLEPGPHRGA